MHGLLQQQEIAKFLRAALECSVHIAPKETGLTLEELFEVGKRVGLERGEILDALRSTGAQSYIGVARLLPAQTITWSQFHFPEEPDYRNVDAFDFVTATLKAIARTETDARARIDRAVLVAQALSKGIRERDIEAAVTIMVIDQHLLEKDGVLRFAQGRENYPSASEQLGQAQGTRVAQHVRRIPERAQAYPLVNDVIERRTDGRPKAAEPFDAFAESLDKLGYGAFRVWWNRTVAELRHAEPTFSPTTVAVFSAALVEGALAFVVKHARGLGLGVFASSDFDRDPRTWKIDDLVSSASAGQRAAIFDQATRHRANELIKVRQRIHAGRMLSDYKTRVPDLRPEEARAARESAEIIVRRILEWLQEHPASTSSPEPLGPR